MVSLSNAEGGVILIGVDDHGVLTHKGPLTAWMRTVHETAASVRECGKYHLRSVKVGDHDVLAVCVQARRNAVAQTAGGLPLVRRGEQDLPLFGNDLAELIISRLQVRYDETPSSVRFDAAEANLIDEVAELFGWNAESGAAMDLMASQSLLTGMPRVLTVAGVLFLTERPREALGKAFIEVRRYVDETTLNYDRREEFDGPAADQVRTATQFVMAELGSDFVVTNLYRHRLPRIPEVVLREAISNAVSHRNYENSGTAIVIELRPGKVILTSPGGLLIL